MTDVLQTWYCHIWEFKGKYNRKVNEAILINGKGKMENTLPFWECFNAWFLFFCLHIVNACYGLKKRSLEFLLSCVKIISLDIHSRCCSALKSPVLLLLSLIQTVKWEKIRELLSIMIGIGDSPLPDFESMTMWCDLSLCPLFAEELSSMMQHEWWKKLVLW